MEDISSNVKFNWAALVFQVLLELVEKKSTGYAVQLSKILTSVFDWTKTKMMDVVLLMRSLFIPKLLLKHLLKLKRSWVPGKRLPTRRRIPR